MFRRLVLAGVAALAATALANVPLHGAYAQSWKKIATKDVDLAAGSASIDTSAAQGKFTALRIYARRARIVMSNVKVIYAGGRTFNERRRINLLPGERTRVINSLNAARFVDRVDLTYRPRRRARRAARIEVWGLQSQADAQAVRRTDQFARPPGGIAAPAAAGDVVPETDAGTVFFGLKAVGFDVDHDVIPVGRAIGRFDKIRLRVRDNDIYLDELKVVYGNGQPDVIAYDAQVRSGTRSRWLPLKGGRFIKQIELKYRAKPNFRGQARVEVFGQYAKGWLESGGEGKKFNRGWVYLGGQSPLFFSIRRGLGYEKDIVEVGHNKGGFARLRVDVRDRAITLREMTVVYGDGTVDIIPVKRKVSAGTSYGPVDLQGGSRVIKEIRVRYRSRLLDANATGKSYAFVEFWGKH